LLGATSVTSYDKHVVAILVWMHLMAEMCVQQRG
jgi:hypothetical protein